MSRIINKEFFWSIVLACLIGCPLGFLAIRAILVQISPEISNPGILPLVISLAGLLLTAVIAVSGHLYNAYARNPVAYLRDE